MAPTAQRQCMSLGGDLGPSTLPDRPIGPRRVGPKFVPRLRIKFKYYLKYA